MMNQLNINKMKNLNFKIMRKIAFTMLMLLTLTLNAQDKDVVKFMGIPVDGTKSEMISKIQQKGFTYNGEYDYLDGYFNGQRVHVYVHTYKDKVDRIMVASQRMCNTAEIINEFNSLLYDFEKSDKYIPSLLHLNQRIDEKEDISYEMIVHNKIYNAYFNQIGSKQDVDEFKEFLSENFDSFEESFKNSAQDEIISNILNDDTQSRNEKIAKIADLYSMANSMNNLVWFKIAEFSGEYYLVIFYDNESNRPNGEDL